METSTGRAALMSDHKRPAEHRPYVACAPLSLADMSGSSPRRRRSLSALVVVTAGVAVAVGIAIAAHLPVVLLPVVLLALFFLVTAAFDISHVVLPRTRTLLVTMAAIAALGRGVLSPASQHPGLLDGLAVVSLTFVVIDSAALFKRLCDWLATARF